MNRNFKYDTSKCNSSNQFVHTLHLKKNSFPNLPSQLQQQKTHKKHLNFNMVHLKMIDFSPLGISSLELGSHSQVFFNFSGIYVLSTSGNLASKLASKCKELPLGKFERQNPPKKGNHYKRKWIIWTNHQFLGDIILVFRGKWWIFQRHWGETTWCFSQWQCLKKGSSLPPRSRIAAFKARFPHQTLKFKAIQLKIHFPSNLPLASVRSEASFTDEKIQAML